LARSNNDSRLDDLYLLTSKSLDLRSNTRLLRLGMTNYLHFLILGIKTSRLFLFKITLKRFLLVSWNVTFLVKAG